MVGGLGWSGWPVGGRELRRDSPACNGFSACGAVFGCGGRPACAHLSLLRQRKMAKKGDPASPPFGSPVRLHPGWLAQNSPVLRPCSNRLRQTAPPAIPVLGGSDGTGFITTLSELKSSQATGLRYSQRFAEYHRPDHNEPLCPLSRRGPGSWAGAVGGSLSEHGCKPGEFCRRPTRCPDRGTLRSNRRSGIAFLCFLSLARQRKEGACGAPPAPKHRATGAATQAPPISSANCQPHPTAAMHPLPSEPPSTGILDGAVRCVCLSPAKGRASLRTGHAGCRRAGNP